LSALFAQTASPEVRFRPLRDQDIDAVSRIESDVYAFPWSAGNFRDSLLAGYRCWGCWHTHGAGEELVGYAILMPAVDEAHLLNLAVAKLWQRYGIGRRLLHFIMAEARRLECVMLYLEVRPSNVAAISLYESVGFRQLGMRRDYYPALAGREDALFFGLELI
jgi:[ribosomal protein S18]-alanine N-acetyltransferase